MGEHVVDGLVLFLKVLTHVNHLSNVGRWHSKCNFEEPARHVDQFTLFKFPLVSLVPLVEEELLLIVSGFVGLEFFYFFL